MAKSISFHMDARKKMESGVNKLADTVKMPVRLWRQALTSLQIQ